MLIPRVVKYLVPEFAWQFLEERNLTPGSVSTVCSLNLNGKLANVSSAADRGADAADETQAFARSVSDGVNNETLAPC